jgi:rhodanese-related sulfurtransferase
MVIKMKRLFTLSGILLCLILLLAACDNNGSSSDASDLPVLPPPEPDSTTFGVDLNINIYSIDDYLERPDVTYIDVRMLYDPADFEAIGGISSLTRTLPGYRIVPYPFVGTLSAMPVGNAYEGDTLFDIEWGDGHTILSISPNYTESVIILDQIFPKDRVIFLMCGGGGYSALMRSLLINQGWDANLIYNTGGNWHYDGNRAVDLTISATNRNIATWRANYAPILFEHLTPIS